MLEVFGPIPGFYPNRVKIKRGAAMRKKRAISNQDIEYWAAVLAIPLAPILVPFAALILLYEELSEWRRR